MSIGLSNNLSIGSPFPLDDRYLYFTASQYQPYPSTASVISSLKSGVRYTGLTVLVGTSSTQPYPQEYWWQNGTSDSQLVLKQSLATGNITGSASTGYVALWTGTTSIGYTSSLYWNSNINGLLVGTNISNGTYSLQANGDVYFRGTGNNNNGLSIQHASPSISGVAIYSSTYKSAFGFYSLSGTSYMRGAVSTGPLLSIEDTNSSGNSNPLSITAKVPSGGWFTSSFNFLTMAVYPDIGTVSNGASLNQQYYYRDNNQLSLGNTSSSYRPLGLYGVIFESGTFSTENTSFRWRTMINGSLSETMKLFGNSLLIGYSQSQGTYSLQVNGNGYFSGNISANGSITAQTGGFDSDKRLKSDIIYNPAIEGIDSIKSASYVIGGNYHIGYIAQEVENIIPSSIIKKEDGYLALNYNEVLVAKVAYLENKVKELYDIIERNGLK